METPTPETAAPSSTDIHESRLSQSPEEFKAPENHAFRKKYRQLTPSEAALSDAIKDQAMVLLVLIEQVPQGRDRSLAITHLEDTVMRAIRAVTA